MTNGALPWKLIENKDDVGRYKERCRTDGQAEFFANCPKLYIEIMEYIDELRYYSMPDYQTIYNLLRVTIHAEKFEMHQFDWEVKN